MKFQLSVCGYRFKWKNSNWGSCESFGKNCPGIYPGYPVFMYLSSGPVCNEKQFFQLVPSHNNLGFHFTPVDVTGFIYEDMLDKHLKGIVTDAYWGIGSGAPIGAFMRELEFEILPQETSCSCPAGKLFNQGCCCGGN